MGKYGKAVIALSILVGLGVWALLDSATCGPMYNSMRSGHGLTGGPHYFKTFNHNCWPWDPQDLYTDDTTPKTTDRQVIAAWFDSMKRMTKTQKYYDHSKADWWQEITYDERGRLQRVRTGGDGSATRRYDYSGGWFNTSTMTVE